MQDLEGSMKSDYKNILYNPTTKKNLTLDNIGIYTIQISNQIYSDIQNNKYLVGEIQTVNYDGFKDYLTVLINIDTLEFDSLYSNHQARIILIIQNKNKSFIDI